MITVDNLTKEFNGQVAVDGLSFAVNEGDIVGFLGPNGAGKSTTMKMLTGFLPMTAGCVKIADIDINDNPMEIKRRIGYLPEGAPAYQEMTVYQFLRFIGKARGIGKQALEESIQTVVQQVELGGVLDQPIDTLSKGFKRRVGIAQALIHDPQILILDEPTDGLDPNQKHQVRQLIMNLAANKIVIISTHILEEVTAVCNRVMIIADGQMRFDGTPKQLVESSKYHNAVVLKLTYVADISGMLELDGVAHIEHDSRNNTLTVLAEPGSQIMPTLQKFVDTHKLPVDYMYPMQGKLDEVFRTMTQSKGKGAN